MTWVHYTDITPQTARRVPGRQTPNTPTYWPVSSVLHASNLKDRSHYSSHPRRGHRVFGGLDVATCLRVHSWDSHKTDEKLLHAVSPSLVYSAISYSTKTSFHSNCELYRALWSDTVCHGWDQSQRTQIRWNEVRLDEMMSDMDAT